MTTDIVNSSDNDTKTLECKGRNGQIFVLDISDKTCEQFGLFHKDILYNKEIDRKATVIGVYNGDLYFLVEGDPGISYWSNSKNINDFEKHGFFLFSRHNEVNSINNENFNEVEENVIMNDFFIEI